MEKIKRALFFVKNSILKNQKKQSSKVCPHCSISFIKKLAIK